jgi:hypothetical protein
MLTTLMSRELVTARHTELIAVAEDERLAHRMRRARRDERRSARPARVRRTSVRTATQPARS